MTHPASSPDPDAFLAFIDTRHLPDLAATPVAGVPLLAWAIRALLLSTPPGHIAVATETDTPAHRIASNAGVHALDTAATESLFLQRLDLGKGRPELVAPIDQPFCSPATATNARRAADQRGHADIAEFQTSPIERTRITDDNDLELATAIARGLDPAHPAIAGINRLKIPLAADIRAVIADVDGTLTNGDISFTGSNDPGEEPGRAFDTRDGLGMKLLQRAGIGVAILSSTLRGESSRQRMQMLGVEHVDVGPGEKGPRFDALCKALNVTPQQVIYIGDDVNDLPAMERAALVATPADAHPAVRNRADIVLQANGGSSAFRELADILLDAHHLNPINDHDAHNNPDRSVHSFVRGENAVG